MKGTDRRSRVPAWIAAAVVALALAGCAKPPPLVTRPASPPASVVFEHPSVFDVTTGTQTADQDVLVTGTTITAIGASGSLAVPAGSQHVDGRGATLVPGLVDSHGHVANSPAPPWLREFPDADRNLQSFLYCGVTTVLDPADLEPDAFQRREGVASGKLLGPTIFAAGPMLTAVGGHPIPVVDAIAPWWLRWYVKRHAVRPLASTDDVRKAIDELAADRADFVKLAIDAIPDGAPELAAPLAAAVVRMAHEKGLRVVAHVGSLADALEAGNAGVDAFMHMVYREPLDEESAAKIAAFGKPVVPTMGVFESYALTGTPRVPTPLERETADARILASFDKIPPGAISPEFEKYFGELKQNRQAWRKNVLLMHQKGITLLAGSDAQSGVFPGPGLHRELALLVEGGLTAAEALRAATWDPARFIEKTEDPSFGRVAVGKKADLLLVDGDPGRDVAALSKIRAVMKSGVVIERHAVAGN
ncbi:MAG TPA: amidohydrolase family protein [Candidatus Binatia bacterium]|jgi:imidazolonepropionase-like amidohydrolase